jgi:tetratricopeptide (TPR) repeat protein
MKPLRFAIVSIAALATLAAAQLPSTGNLFEQYAKGNFAALAPPRTPTDLDRFWRALEHDAEPWLRRGDARTARQRQLVVATIALDAARASLDMDWAQGRRFVEWGAEILRRGRPDDGERLWHLAALSLMQGAHDYELIVAQQKLAWPRFQEEPRFLLALAVALEASTWPDPDRAGPWDDDESELRRAAEQFELRRKMRQRPDLGLREKAAEFARRERMQRVIEALEDLSNAESIRAEALMRLGYLHLRLRRAEIAIEQFEDAAGMTDDPFVLYLSHFLKGNALEQVGDRANAIESYRAALDVAPRAQSASFALASLLFLGDGRREAADLIAAALETPVAIDPWREYQSGDFRFWDERFTALREALR